jgi:hypothetical protein
MCEPSSISPLASARIKGCFRADVFTRRARKPDGCFYVGMLRPPEQRRRVPQGYHWTNADQRWLIEV